jgi:hypothetical protein
MEERQAEIGVGADAVETALTRVDQMLTIV